MGILIKNNIVNQKGTPAFYEDTLANRPTANLQGRMFVDTNNPSTGIYRDTGSSWVPVADPGAGTTGTLQQVTTNGSTTNVGISITTLTPGSVLFSGTGGLISQDNTNLYWDDTNNFLGIGPTGGPTALLDIHSATQNVFVQVNATSTNNSTIAFLNGGVGKWRVGNLYNAGSNDFTIYDTTNATSRLTIANTGTATYTGFIVVNNLSTAQNIQILGTAPAYTMGITSGGNYGGSFGMASVANNFIQGSALGDMCIVNQTVGGANLKLGVLSANAAAINISPNNRVQIATSTDAGFAFDVNGTARISGKATITGSTTASSLLAQGQYISSTLVAAANNDVLVGLDINPTYTNGAFTGVTNAALRTVTGNVLLATTSGNVGISTSSPQYKLDVNGTTGTVAIRAASSTSNDILYYGTGTVTGDLNAFQTAINATGKATINLINSNTSTGAAFINIQVPSTSTKDPYYQLTTSGATNWSIGIKNSNADMLYIGANTDPSSGSPAMAISTGGNTMIGITTDAGYKLDVNGTARATSYNVGTSGQIITATSTNTITLNVSGAAQANYILSSSTYSDQFATASGDFQMCTNGARDITFLPGNNRRQIRISVNAGTAIGDSNTTDVPIIASAVLAAVSTTRGFLPPKLTTTQKTTISSPATGLMVYDTNLNKLSVYTGAAWETVTSV